jgi:hypothetical protein
MINSGIFLTKNSMMPISKVTDMSFLRPLFGQILGYGTLRVESAGQKQDLERIEYVPRPEEVFMAISELVFGDKKQPRSPLLESPRSSRRGRWGSVADCPHLCHWFLPGTSAVRPGNAHTAKRG